MARSVPFVSRYFSGRRKPPKKQPHPITTTNHPKAEKSRDRLYFALFVTIAVSSFWSEDRLERPLPGLPCSTLCRALNPRRRAFARLRLVRQLVKWDLVQGAEPREHDHRGRRRGSGPRAWRGNRRTKAPQPSERGTTDSSRVPRARGGGNLRPDPPWHYARPPNLFRDTGLTPSPSIGLTRYSHRAPSWYCLKFGPNPRRRTCSPRPA